MYVSLKDKDFCFQHNHNTIIQTNTKSIFTLSRLSYKSIYFTVWSNQDPEKIHILQLADMSLKFLLMYRFIFPFLLSFIY